MTCIVGMEYDGKVCIGGDSAGSANGRFQLFDTPKVFKKQNLLIGYTWSFRMGQIIQYSKSFPKLKKQPDNYTYLVDCFVPFLRETFKTAGWLWVENSREEGGRFLVGIRGELYVVDSNFAVLRSRDGYNAIGSGEDYALGVMRVLKENVNRYSEIIEPPRYMVELALETAAYFLTTVSAPLTIKEL